MLNSLLVNCGPGAVLVAGESMDVEIDAGELADKLRQLLSTRPLVLGSPGCAARAKAWRTYSISEMQHTLFIPHSSVRLRIDADVFGVWQHSFMQNL